VKKDLSKIAPWIGGLLVVSVISLVMFTRERPRHPLEGEPAPELAGELMAGEGAGDRVRLQDLQGEVVVLDFWASWCRPCRESIPRINRVREDLGDEVRFYGVNTEGGMRRAALATHHRSLGTEFPTFQDVDGSMARSFQVTALPTLFVIGPDGQIQHVETGAVDESGLRSTISEILQASR